MLQPVLTPEGFQLLESLSGIGTYTPKLAAKLNQGLRKRGVDAELVAAILTQMELREAARDKFGPFADSLLLTRDGLEQATRLTVAAHHAARFRRAGCQKVADLGCGIGGESLAFAGVGLLVEAFEIDEATAAAALMNLRAFPEAKVTQADITELDWETLRTRGVDGAFADPARRDKHGRKLKPKHWHPPLATVLSWRDEVPCENLGVKVAPGIDYELLPGDAEVTWVSVGGELVEAGIWLGDLREKPGRSALLIGADGHVRAALREAELSGAANSPAREAEVIGAEADLGTWIFEPDAAIIRAGLVARVSELSGARCVSTGIAYLTGDGLGATEVGADSRGATPATAPFPAADSLNTNSRGATSDGGAASEAGSVVGNSLRACQKLGACFEVLEVYPLDEKPLKKALKARGVRSLEIKKRGADINPSHLRKKILPKPDPQGEDLTLIATRIAGRHRAILARRTPVGTS